MSVDKVTKGDVEDALAYFKIKCDEEYLSADSVATKLYDDLGTATDGAVSQATVTAELVKKADSNTVTAALSAKANTADVNTALSKKLDSDATATKATKLETARSLKVSLSSSAAQTFDGSADATQIGVAGTLPVGNGGTGKTNLSEVTVGTATKADYPTGFAQRLTSQAWGVQTGTFLTGWGDAASGNYGAITFRKNCPEAGKLSMTTDGYFYQNESTYRCLDTSDLPLSVAYGGTGKTNLNDVTVGAATKATQDGAGNVITDTYVTKTAFEETIDNIRRWRKIPIYGYRIDKNEADPYARVEYILDAAGMTPASYDSSTDIIGWGSWKNIWFIDKCKPCMLKYDGTVDYYLDKNDYTKKADGTASDVANTAYGGNAMAQIPLVWIYRYEDANYQYEIISPEKIDDNFKAYAHTNANGVIKPYFYLGIFESSGDSSRLRSIKNQTPLLSTPNVYFSGARGNGSNWTNISWLQRSLITTLTILIEKKSHSGSNAAHKYFYYINKNWTFCEGALMKNGYLYVKPTPEGNGYSITGTDGYTYIKRYTANNSGYVSTMSLNEYGYFANTWGGAVNRDYSAYWSINNFNNSGIMNFNGTLAAANLSVPDTTYSRLSYV